jgi:pyridoxamine 5'-phosphate oxidase
VNAPPDPLDVDTVDPDPLHQLARWYDDAQAAGVRQPEAMTITTVTPDGLPAARMVLMRGLDERGIAFYTNLHSAKARDLAQRPYAALVFHWRELERQVRVRGPVTPLTGDEAAAYWATRPRGHRIAAWASPQSEVVEREDLERRVAEVEARFTGVDPPLPEFWGGYLVAVDELECWQSGTFRLHDRVRYRRDADAPSGWAVERLAP